jgi:hypothetical protein
MTSSPFPLYPPGSFAKRWQRFGAILGGLAILWTAQLAYDAPACETPRKLILLAALWGVWPPLWWWIEFFFIYPRHHTPEKFELLKHGAQASLAIWAPIAVALAAYSASDYFKAPEEGKSRTRCTAGSTAKL